MDNSLGCCLTIVNSMGVTFKVQTFLKISKLTNETKKIIDEFLSKNFKDVSAYNLILYNEKGGLVKLPVRY